MSFVDTIVGHPRIYNLLMDVAGRNAVLRPIQPWLDQLTGRVIDVGGGTGRIREKLRTDVRFSCLDVDLRKLRYSTGAVAADATALPFADRSIDGALLIGVTHHLNESVVHGVVAELARVLGPRGQLIVLDAVSVAAPNLTSRALWWMDRGHHPHTTHRLETALRQRFDIQDTSTYTVLHHYAAWRCTGRS